MRTRISRRARKRQSGKPVKYSEAGKYARNPYNIRGESCCSHLWIYRSPRPYRKRGGARCERRTPAVATPSCNTCSSGTRLGRQFRCSHTRMFSEGVTLKRSADRSLKNGFRPNRNRNESTTALCDAPRSLWAMIHHRLFEVRYPDPFASRFDRSVHR
jgi:hypothetical protein